MEFEQYKPITKSKREFINNLISQYDKEEATHLRKILESDVYTLSEDEALKYYNGCGCGFIEFDYHSGLISDLKYTSEKISFSTVGSSEQNCPKWKRGHYKNVVVNDTRIRLAVVMSCTQMIRWNAG